jgi:hypothetical protein
MTRLAYPLLLLLLLGLVFASLILQPGYLLYPRGGQATDLTITHWPAVAFNLHSLHQDGQIPLWQTAIVSGGPWLANPQSWLLYPPAWLFYILPINLTFNLLLLAHLFVAAAATYVFGRRALKLAPPGAALAGLAFAGAPWLSAQLAAGHVNVVLALAWLPVALLGADRAASTARLDGALLTGVAWTAALLNHIQMAAFAATLTVAWFLFRIQAPRLLKTFRVLFLTTAVALLLSAALLIPLAEALPYLNRTALTVDQAGVFSLPWSHLLTTVIPTYAGEPEQVVYLGLPVALLAAFGLALKPDRLTLFWTVVIALACLFTLGVNAPLFPLVAHTLPALSWLRVPPRAWVLVSFGLALLAGRGLDALTSPRLSPSARHRVSLIALAALVAGLLLATGLLFLIQPTPLAAWVLAAFSLVSVVALVLRARSRLRPTPFAIASLVLAALDLGLVHAAWTEMVSPADAFAWGAETAEYLARKPGPFRTYSPSYSLPQHTALQHGLSLADGANPIQLRSYAEFLAVAGGYQQASYSPTLPPVLDDTSAQPDARLLGLLNVEYVAAEWPIEAEDLVLETQIGETRIYRNDQVLPRAFVVAQARHEQQPGGASLAWPIQATPARIVLYTPNRIVVKAELSTPGLLVLSEVWYPGWRARDNGIDIPVLRTDAVLRGVYLEAGAHTVEFEYRPWTALAGGLVSGITALGLLVYAAVHMRRHT